MRSPRFVKSDAHVATGLWLVLPFQLRAGRLETAHRAVATEEG